MITELIRALRAGEELKNAETWKNAQITTNALVAIATALVAGLSMVGISLPVTNEQLIAIAGGVAAIGGLFNTYTTAATSKRVGLPAKPVDNPEVVAVADNPVSGGD
jgi:hypothetical protein